MCNFARCAHMCTAQFCDAKKDALPIPTVEEHDFLSLLGAQHAHPLLSDLHEHGWWYLRVVLMIIGLITSLWAVYSTTVGVLTTFSHVYATISSVLALPISAFRPRDRPRLSVNQTHMALLALSSSVASRDVYFLDSGCSYTIISNASVIHYLHEIPPVTIEGLKGTRVLTQGGMLTLTVPDFNGIPHVIVIPNVLYSPQATVNLLSVKQMNCTGYGFVLMPNEDASAIIVPMSSWKSQIPHYLPLIQQNNVFMLEEIDAEISPDTGDRYAYNVTFLSSHTGRDPSSPLQSCTD
eukprot:3553507-Rhodomonas_salina.1